MIPRKIHFVWLSDEAYPAIVKECMQTWRRLLPDYVFIHWDMEKVSKIDNFFLKETLQVKKWAFATDFIRMYILYHEGGIYLDTDVMVYKNFDDLLSNKAFIGKESTYHVRRRHAYQYLTSHCMGAEPGNPFIKACLDYYNNRPFILSEEEWLPDTLRYDLTILPFIQTEIAKLFGYHPSERIKGIQQLNNDITIYPGDYFDAKRRTENSYCSHIGLEGWRSKDQLSNPHASGKLSQMVGDSIKKLVELTGYVCFKKL